MVPCLLARLARTPRGDRILQMGNRRKRVAQQPDVQFLFGRFDKPVKGGVQVGVIRVLWCSVLWSNLTRLTGSNERRRQIMIDMRVYARKRELNPRDPRIAAH